MMKTDFEAMVRMNIRDYPEWRFGQVLFNSLMDLRPEWAEEIRGTKNDPFYADDKDSDPRLGNFYTWLDARTF